MSKSSSRLIVASSALLLLLAAAAGAHHGAARSSAAGDCSGKSEDCHAPVKYLGERGDCACFACEYRTKKQHILCTRNDAEKTKLFQIIHERPPE
ncbi:MAG: hypothetical protein JOZ96_14905 [Acidobacteria bacterium]|nr:hypothetical protein [Acidobacteriota bacterium]